MGILSEYQDLCEARTQNIALCNDLCELEQELLAAQEECSLRANIQLQLFESEQEVARCRAEHDELLQANEELSEACNDVASKMLCDQPDMSAEVTRSCELQTATPAECMESIAVLQQENVYLQAQNRDLLKTKQRTAALQEENRRLQDRIWRLCEIEQK